MSTDLPDGRLRGTPLFCLILVAVICLFVSYGLVSAVLGEYGTWRTDRRLARIADEVVGSIVGKRIEKRTAQTGRPTEGYQTIHWLHYAYTTADGERFEDRRRIPENVYDSYEKGGTVSIKIDAERPNLNLPEFVVVQRKYELGFAGVLGGLSLCITIAIWCLVFLCLTGRVDSRSLANLLSGDLFGRTGGEGRPDCEPVGGQADIRQIKAMVKAGKKLEAIKLLRREHNMSLQEARETVDGLTEP